MQLILLYVLAASGLRSTTYGYNEKMCGDIGKPVECAIGSITASGEGFNPNLPTAAVFSPTSMIMKPTVIPVRIASGKCKFIRINDKGSPRFIGRRGFDLSPSAVRLLGGKPTLYWSGTIYVCTKLLNKNLTRYEVILWNTK